MNSISHEPAVSVVIPTYNAGDYLIEAINSVIEQTYRDFEIIVVDDASTDDTAARIQQFQKGVKYLRQEHGGSSVARNRGILASRGRYIAFLDADDTWYPSKLEKQMDYFSKHPDTVLVYTDFHRSESNMEDAESALRKRKHWVVGRDFMSLLRQNFIHTSSVVIARDILPKTGIFDPRMTNAQDWDLWVRIADAGNFGLVDEILTRYRQHDLQTVRTLNFSRNVVYADRVLLARYSNDPEAAHHIKAKLGYDLWILGRRAWKSGNSAEAQSAFWGSAREGYRTVRSAGRASWCFLASLWPRNRDRTAARDRAA